MNGKIEGVNYFPLVIVVVAALREESMKYRRSRTKLDEFIPLM